MAGPVVKFGADCFGQFTDWKSFVAAMQRADALGYDSLWTPDHVLPSSGSHEGPILEPYMAMAGAAAVTSAGTLGLLVSPISLRNPAMVTKMITTLDHISGGRAVLGIGAGWAEEEYRQYGAEFGSGFGERLRWLKEALPVIRGMLDGTRPTAQGPRFQIRDVVNSPLPVQARLPILVGGGGEKVTLRLVAEFADMCNVVGSPEQIAVKERALLGHCDDLGRDPAEIERSVAIRQPIIRDSRDDAIAVLDTVLERHGAGFLADACTPGTVDDLVELCAKYVDLGYRHLIFQFLSPFDDETMSRLITEVRPRLTAGS